MYESPSQRIRARRFCAIVLLGAVVGTGATAAGATTLLDSFLPTSHYRDVQTIHVQAAPSLVRAELRSVTPDQVPGLRAFVLVAGGPRLRLTPEENASMRLPMIEALRRRNLLVLGERSGDELVMGGIGKIWEQGCVWLRDAAAYRSFRDPHFARLAMNVRVRPGPNGGTLLSTETRVLCPDPEERGRLDRYWRLWHPGAAIVRDQWLEVVRRRAEAAARKGR